MCARYAVPRIVSFLKKGGLAARRMRSGRDIDNVPVFVASVRDMASKRIANIVFRNAKRREEVAWLRDPRDTQGEGPERRRVGLTAGSSELSFGPSFLLSPVRWDLLFLA